MLFKYSKSFSAFKIFCFVFSCYKCLMNDNISIHQISIDEDAAKIAAKEAPEYIESNKITENFFSANLILGCKQCHNYKKKISLLEERCKLIEEQNTILIKKQETLVTLYDIAVDKYKTMIQANKKLDQHWRLMKEMLKSYESIGSMKYEMEKQPLKEQDPTGSKYFKTVRFSENTYEYDLV